MGHVAERVLLSGCTIVDATAPQARADQSILVVDGRVAAVEDAGTLVDADVSRVVELDGRYVVPAIWDVHCHPGTAGLTDLAADRDGRMRRVMENLERCAFHGVTGIRAVGEALLSDVAVRDELAAQGETSLTVLVAGPALKPPGGHGTVPVEPGQPRPTLADPWGSLECTGAEGFRDACRELVQDHRVDWVKIFVSGGIAGSGEAHTDTHMSQAEVAAVCEEAHAAGIRVAAHAGNPEAIDLAVRGGVDSIEHGYHMTAENAALLAQRGVWYVPTLSITHNVGRMRTMGWSPTTIAKAQSMARTHRTSLEAARDAGVRIASGSDMRPLGRAGVEEAVLLARECFTPWQALRIATAESAEMCGAGRDHGTVEVGKWASFIVTEANPFDGLEALLRPIATVWQGRVEARGG